jgi:hypothetical protein
MAPISLSVWTETTSSRVKPGTISFAATPVATISMETMATIRSTEAMVMTIFRAIRDLTGASMEHEFSQKEGLLPSLDTPLP